MALELQQVEKIVGREHHLKDINLRLEPGSHSVLLGRTLAGKTSLLRIMAGLDRPTKGKVLVDGQDVTGVIVRKRSVAMVYQQFINYPSLSVYKNIASPLKLAGMDKKEIDAKVREMAEMLHLEDMLERLPTELSGGQQQRTAIARALVKDAQLLLLDEPLVNLDYKLREELREELQDIFKMRNAIVVYTTTEPTEALMLGGTIVVVDEGRILQSGETMDVYHRPATLRVAEVFSDPPINYMDGIVEDDHLQIGAAARVPLSAHLADLAQGRYRVGMRASHLSLEKTDASDIVFEGDVTLAEINGSETFIHIDHDGQRLVVQEGGIHSRKMGEKIAIHMASDSLYVYSSDGALIASPVKFS